MSAFDRFLESMSGKSVTVIGIGVSNTPLNSLLLEAGANVTVHDRKSIDDLGEIYEGLADLGVQFCVGNDYLKNLSGDYIFRTPGMHPNQPALVKAREQGSIITSEMEVFMRVCPCPIFAITGSDGKTTTTTLTAEILKKAGYACHLGGNIGRPLLADVPFMTEQDIAVVELSSFQLMNMQCSPAAALVTNVTPNHLDVHKDMAEYIEAKTNIFVNQKPGAKLVLNADDAVSQDFKPADGVELLYFSMKQPVENGVYLQDGVIWYAEDGNRRKIMDASEIRIPGAHNIANYMAATCLTHGKVSFEDVREVAHTFGGVEHRLELVRTLNGVRYYNDSIASSPTRTAAGLRAFDQKVILLAGGHDKKIPYDSFGPVVCDHVKRLILIDANPDDSTAPAIKASVLAAENYDPNALMIDTYDDFEKAVKGAAAAAEDGDIVLMSPASASFDIFKNFMERGNRFKDIVRSL
ncbi:MAG: UDP-N-acetylmuramoyl-L-alanine--D-glutamate ligase [Eubacteriales bacterium]|nr:UDP-N-acetylmuramoyl-L-alanine--D-glutamate ligase [Eubacteriales bacterium]